MEDPIANQGLWTSADKPWQFLAFCYEWVGYLDAEARGETFVSHLPIAMDGSCSGIQHFSAMIRDEEGGKAVNLVPMDTPQDIYQVVCDRVLTRFKGQTFVRYTGDFDDPDTEKVPPNPFAEKLLTLPLDRKMTKKQVMTVPYGLTARSCTDYTRDYFNELKKQLEKDGKTLPWSEEEHWEVMKYVSGHIWEAIKETITGAREVMEWLQEVTKVALKAREVPLQWETPMGLPIMQCNRKYKKSKFFLETEGRKEIEVKVFEPNTNTINHSKMKTSIAPNFVHSMDASHLALTVCAAQDNLSLTSFAVIHDSFGTHAANAEDFARCLREAFVSMYSEHDVLTEFKRSVEESVQRSVGEDVLENTVLECAIPNDIPNVLPEMPCVRFLDLNQVTESTYFFA